jgi:ABC-2 type transport system permease protein
LPWHPPLLTANVIAFIFGAVFCSVLVFVDSAAGLFSETLGREIAALGLFGHFDDFADGVVSLSGLVYFISVGGLFLYFNVLLLGKRHWPRKADGYPMAVSSGGGQYQWAISGLTSPGRASTG